MLQCDSKHEAASSYVDAANCYKKTSPKGVVHPTLILAIPNMFLLFPHVCLAFLNARMPYTENLQVKLIVHVVF